MTAYPVGPCKCLWLLWFCTPLGFFCTHDTTQMETWELHSALSIVQWAPPANEMRHQLCSKSWMKAQDFGCPVLILEASKSFSCGFWWRAPESHIWFGSLATFCAFSKFGHSWLGYCQTLWVNGLIYTCSNSREFRTFKERQVDGASKTGLKLHRSSQLIFPVQETHWLLMGQRANFVQTSEDRGAGAGNGGVLV